MTANVEISDTFDQWRVKTNEVVVATQTDGSSNFIKLTNTTDSSSNTTGSIITAGGVGIAKSVTIGEDLEVVGGVSLAGFTINSTSILLPTTDKLYFRDTGLSIQSPTNGTLDIAADTILEITAPTMNVISTTVDFDANVVIHSTLTVNSTTALVGTTLPLHFRDTGLSLSSPTDGTLDIAADGILEITAPTTNVIATTAVTIHTPAITANGTVTVGADTDGYDVTFYGAAAGALMLWDESEDSLIVRGATADHATTSAGRIVLQTNQAAVADGDVIGRIDFQPSGETGADALLVTASIYAEADATFDATTNNTELVFAVSAGDAVVEKMRLDSAGKVGIGTATPASVLHVTGTVQVGVNDTGHDVVFYGAAAGAMMMWDEDADSLLVRGATADAAGSSGRLVLQTAQVSVEDGDILGRIDFNAPLETQGSDAILVSAAIWAEADDTFTASVNNTELVFATATTTAAAEKMRLDSGGKLGIGTATPASLLDVQGTVQVGVDNTGYDVKFFGATASNYWLWDEDADGVVLVGSHTITGDSQLTGALTVGVNDTGHDVIFYGAAAGAMMKWDQAADALLVRGATADAAGSSGRIVLQTAQVAITDGDILGRVDFQAPLETQGSDGALVTASIYAEADDTFTATVNHTDLVFATGSDGAVTEKFRIDSTGQATFADGAIDVNIASHDGTNGLKLGGTVVTATAANLNLVTGAGTLKEVGKETIWVPANAMSPTESNGCSDLTAVETTSGRPDMRVLDFDKDSDEFAQFAIAFPKSWNLGTVTFQVFWSGIAATSDVDWGLQAVAMNDNETIDVAYGTAVVVTDNAQGAVEELLVSAESGAITIAGTPADNDLCYFRIYRDVSGDAMAGDARLHGVKIFFTTDAANDA
jgi:hypothetical protein